MPLPWGHLSVQQYLHQLLTGRKEVYQSYGKWGKQYKVHHNTKVPPGWTEPERDSQHWLYPGWIRWGKAHPERFFLKHKVALKWIFTRNLHHVQATWTYFNIYLFERVTDTEREKSSIWWLISQIIVTAQSHQLITNCCWGQCCSTAGWAVTCDAGIICWLPVNGLGMQHKMPWVLRPLPPTWET